MGSVRIKNANLNGAVTVPCSKSVAHRAAVCAFLSGGSTVHMNSVSEDILATQNGLKALAEGGVVDCNESGSTLRFLIPVAAALGKGVTFTGRGRLPERPIGEYLQLLPEHGVTCESSGGLPLTISGQLTPGRYALPGNISSQYVTGLLLALPILKGDSEIILTTALESGPYVELTLDVMRTFGVTVKKTDKGYFIPGNQRYAPKSYTVEGDWSQAAFFLAGGALTGEVTVNGLAANSAQGDKKIVDILRQFGAEVTLENNGVTVKKAALKGISVNVSDVPDMVPSIAVLAAFADGVTEITGGKRLRIKESDRIASVVENLKKMGVHAYERTDGMVIEGGRPKGAALEGYNDHRIVMAFSIAALCAEGETTITDAQSIRKSYPGFLDDYSTLGGKADAVCNR